MAGGQDLLAGTSGGGSRGGGSRRRGGQDLLAGTGGGAGRGGHGRKKKGGGGGFFGTLGDIAGTAGEIATNFGVGAERAVLGIPDAGHAIWHDTAHLAELLPGGHQKGEKRLTGWELAPIGKAYAYKYGPLFAHGQFGKTAHRALVEDPFGTLLDVATVYGAAERGATLAGVQSGVRQLPLRGPEALARAGKTLRKTDLTVITRDQPAVVGGRAIRGPALLPRALHAAVRALPAETPIVGELARFNRALATLPRGVAAARRLRAIPLDKALRKLTRNERAASALVARWPLPRLLDEQIVKWEAKAGTGEDVTALQIATDPKIRALYEQPTPKMTAALGEAQRLAAFDAEVLAKYGRLSPEVAAEAPYLHMRMASGAEFTPRALAPDEFKVGAFVRPTDRLNIGRITEINGDIAKVHFFNRATGLEEDVNFSAAMLRHPTETELVGGNTIEDIAAETAAAGRPQPVYLHDTAVGKTTGPSFEPAGGGTSPTPRDVVQRNEGILAGLGQLILDPGTLVEQHFRTVKYALYRDTHATLEDIGLHVPQGSKLPKDWEYLRRAVGPKQATGEKIGYVERTAGEHARAVEELVGTPEKEAELGKQLTTMTEAEAATLENGDRLIVPTSTVKALSGEFHRSSKAVRWLIERPLDVWRAILLNWSPRWLVNNVVGNTFMAMVRFGGVKFIRNWLAAVQRHSGPAAIEQLLKDQKTTARLTDDEIAAIFPEAFTGTFKAENMPFQRSIAGGRFRRLAREGLSPIDRGYEQRLRSAAYNTQIQKSPEAAAIYKRMPRQTRSWRAASKAALRDNPALVKKITQEVNSGLGDFTSLSPFERNYLRRLVPFYAWYRAVTGVVLRLPFEVPLRARFIAQLSQIRQEDQDLLNPDLPPWLRGAVPFGDNGALLTQGINPYATVPQVGRGVGYAAGGGDYRAAQNFLGLLNPNIQQIPSLLPERGQRSPGLLWTLLSGTYGGLPPIQALHLLEGNVPTTKTYEPLPLDYWLSLAGVPIRHPKQPIRR